MDKIERYGRYLGLALLIFATAVCFARQAMQSLGNPTGQVTGALLGRSGDPTAPAKCLVSFTFRNDSVHDLDWVRLDWDGPSPVGGAMPKGSFKTSYDTLWPNLSKATLTFVDEVTRKRYNVAVSFASANERIAKGNRSHVTVRILDYDKAEVLCD